jgi:hypothetical protein
LAAATLGRAATKPKWPVLSGVMKPVLTGEGTR